MDDDLWVDLSGYWLNSQPRDDRNWVSAEVVLRLMLRREIESWGPEQDGVATLMDQRPEGGGGWMGETPEWFAVRSYLIRVGAAALAWERRLGGRK